MERIIMTAPELERAGFVLQYFDKNGDLRGVKPTLANLKRTYGNDVKFDRTVLFDGENVWEFDFAERISRMVFIELWKE